MKTLESSAYGTAAFSQLLAASIYLIIANNLNDSQRFKSLGIKVPLTQYATHFGGVDVAGIAPVAVPTTSETLVGFRPTAVAQAVKLLRIDEMPIFHSIVDGKDALVVPVAELRAFGLTGKYTRSIMSQIPEFDLAEYPDGFVKAESAAGYLCNYNPASTVRGTNPFNIYVGASVIRTELASWDDAGKVVTPNGMDVTVYGLIDRLISLKETGLYPIDASGNRTEVDLLQLAGNVADLGSQVAKQSSEVSVAVTKLQTIVDKIIANPFVSPVVPEEKTAKDSDKQFVLKLPSWAKETLKAAGIIAAPVLTSVVLAKGVK